MLLETRIKNLITLAEYSPSSEQPRADAYKRVPKKPALLKFAYGSESYGSSEGNELGANLEAAAANRVKTCRDNR
jgi:hypothetical protein